MAHDDENPTDNVINFPRVGFNPGPVIPPAPAPAAPPAPDAAPVAGDDRLEVPARGRRRSPMDVVSALRQPGLDEPVMAGPDFDLAPGAAGLGEPEVPETFRGTSSDSGDGEYGAYGPQIGVLAVAAALAVAVAALRGIHSAVSAWRANREQRQAVERAAAGGSGSGTTSSGRGGRGVQPGHEFGRKTLNRSHDGKQRNSNGNGSGGRGGAGGGKPPRTPSSDRKDRTNRTDRKNNGPGSPGGRGHGGDGAKRKDRKSLDKAPGKDRNGKHKPGSGLVHRTTQAGSRALDRARRKHLDKPGGRSDLTKRPKNRPDRPGSSKHRKPDLSKHHPKKRPGRTTLAGAISEEAARRMKLRRKSMTPPLWSTRKDAGRPDGSSKKPGQPRNRRAGGYWGRAHEKARDYWQRRHAAHTTGPAADTSTPGGTGGAMGAGAFGPRRSGWAGAGMAGETTVILTRIDDVEDTARRAEPAGALVAPFAALPAAPVKHFPRPGTRRPRPMPPAPGGSAPSKEHRMSTLARNLRPGAVPGMDAQHETEVTLDGALDLLQELTKDCFETHDLCVQLPIQARALRAKLSALSEELATSHNVVGQRTSTALAQLAEDMEVLARQAEEMQVESLAAAEKTEAADNALNDAYRPFTQAAADAGLLAPAARIHNQS
jgi:hypothetical protein